MTGTVSVILVVALDFGDVTCYQDHKLVTTTFAYQYWTNTEKFFYQLIFFRVLGIDLWKFTSLELDG